MKQKFLEKLYQLYKTISYNRNQMNDEYMNYNKVIKKKRCKKAIEINVNIWMNKGRWI